jgi:hypothetical protein
VVAKSSHAPPGFSSLTFVSCSQSGASLAKFGYILDMKVKKEIESFYIFGYLLELITNFWQFEVFSFKSGKFQ